MAESSSQKRGPGRPPGSKNKTKSDHASAPNKQEQIYEMQRKYDRDRRNVDVIWSITLVAVGLFLFFTIVMDTTGSFGEHINHFCLGLFGYMAYALPFLVFIFAILLLAGKMQHIGWKTFLFSFLIFLNLCVLNSYRYLDENNLNIGFGDIADQYRNAINGIEGGVLGMEIGGILVRFFGKPGLIIISLAIMLISIFLVANTPISRFVENAIKNREKKKILAKMNQEYEEELLQKETESYAPVMPKPVATEKRKGARAIDMEDTIVMSAEDYRQFRGQQHDDGFIDNVKSIWRSLVGGLTTNDADISRVPGNNARLDESLYRDADSAEVRTDIPRPFGNRNLKSISKDTAPMESIDQGKQFSAKSRVILKDQTPEELAEAKASRDTIIDKIAKRITGRFNISDDIDNFGEEENYGYPGDKKRREAAVSANATKPGYGLGDPDEIIHSGEYGLDGHLKEGSRGLANDTDASEPKKAAELKNAKPVAKKPSGEKSASNITKSRDDTENISVPDKDLDKADAEITAGFAATSDDSSYELPPVSLLKKATGPKHVMSESEIGSRADLLEKTLNDFGVEAKVIKVTQGASVTRYEVQPATGVKVSRITRLADDIALNMRAKTVRIEAPIPGKAAVGIEVENENPSTVLIRELIECDEFMNAKSRIEFVVGKDISGNPIIADMKDMPHLLVAGATGSGKSVCINAIITSFLYKAKPSELKLIMIDPKMVELGNYNDIPHMLTPVVTDPRKAARALAIAVDEMEKRYELLSKEYVKDLESYNEKMIREGRHADKKPEIIIIIDELADLMMAAPSDVENAICRLAQKARAAGMHLIVATQRPSIDVVTGLIKANIPSRIAFTTTSQVDSRVILDMAGAEKLLGKGDMLFSPVGSTKPFRVQGPFISAEEIEKIIKFVKKEGGNPEYDEELKSAIDNLEQKGGSEPEDELTNDAIEFIFKSGQASVSMLQRRFRIGYNRAARIIDEIEDKGIIGPADGARPRQVLISEDAYYGGIYDSEEEMQAEIEAAIDPEIEYTSDSFPDPEKEPEPEPEMETATAAEDEPELYEPAKETEDIDSGVSAFNSLSPEQQAKIMDADYEDDY